MSADHSSTNSSTSTPVPTSHLRNDRWLSRGDPNTSVLNAWERAEPFDVAAAENGRARVPDHDEARWDQESATVLFRRQDDLVTCYSLEPHQVTNDNGRAVREAVDAVFGLPPRLDPRG